MGEKYHNFYLLSLKFNAKSENKDLYMVAINLNKEEKNLLSIRNRVPTLKVTMKTKGKKSTSNKK